MSPIEIQEIMSQLFSEFSHTSNLPDDILIHCVYWRNNTYRKRYS